MIDICVYMVDSFIHGAMYCPVLPNPAGDRICDGSVPWKGKILSTYFVTSGVEVLLGPAFIPQGDVCRNGMC